MQPHASTSHTNAGPTTRATADGRTTGATPATGNTLAPGISEQAPRDPPEPAAECDPRPLAPRSRTSTDRDARTNDSDHSVMAAATTPGEPPERRDHPVAAGEGRSPGLKAAPERKTHPKARPAVPSLGPVLGSPPGSYPRRVLLAVTGLSPQIVTETLFALARLEDAERFVPTEIRVVTTARGAEHLRLSLLSEAPGWFHRLCRDYGLRDVSFSQEQIYLLRDAAGQALADIRTPEENELAADLITDMVRELTAHEDLALHVSLAGGRKTMGYYAGYAAHPEPKSLRPQTRRDSTGLTSRIEVVTHQVGSPNHSIQGRLRRGCRGRV